MKRNCRTFWTYWMKVGAVRWKVFSYQAPATEIQCKWNAMTLPAPEQAKLAPYSGSTR